jgi:hypothetical protein
MILLDKLGKISEQISSGFYRQKILVAALYLSVPPIAATDFMKWIIYLKARRNILQLEIYIFLIIPR